jgi:hypothetical protein
VRHRVDHRRNLERDSAGAFCHQGNLFLASRPVAARMSAKSSVWTTARW